PRLVLEVPDPEDQEVPRADPHPLLQLPRDPPEAGLPVRAVHADPGGPEELVRDPVDLALAVRREPDADDLFLGHGGTIFGFRIRVCGRFSEEAASPRGRPRSPAPRRARSPARGSRARTDTARGASGR